MTLPNSAPKQAKRARETPRRVEEVAETAQELSKTPKKASRPPHRRPKRPKRVPRGAHKKAPRNKNRLNLLGKRTFFHVHLFGFQNVQDGPRGPQDRPKTAQGARKRAPRRPQRRRGPPKTATRRAIRPKRTPPDRQQAPKRPQEASRWPPKLQKSAQEIPDSPERPPKRAPSLGAPRSVVEATLKPSWNALGPLLMLVGRHLGLCWNYLGFPWSFSLACLGPLLRACLLGSPLRAIMGSSALYPGIQDRQDLNAREARAMGL